MDRAIIDENTRRAEFGVQRVEAPSSAVLELVKDMRVLEVCRRAACASLHFNVFVLLVQSFEHVPALGAIAPTHKEPPFAVAQVAVLVVFVGLTALAAKRFHPEAQTSAKVAMAA